MARLVRALVSEPLGSIRGGVDERAPDFLECQPSGREFGRIDLDPNRRPLLTAERDLCDARHLGDLLGEEAVGIFVDDRNR